MPAALAHLKIIDISRILAGPFASQTLGDMGAQVIKVEHPKGDDTRRWGPPFVTRADGSIDAAYFFCCNRNKTNICLDFTKEEDKAILLELIKEADVLIENYKVGSLSKYGLDDASVRAINPNIIYCSITGFGQTGPYKDRPGYDALIQGMGGLMSITGEADGAPQKVGVAVVDLMTGMYAATAILAALSYRDKTGIGQNIDLSLFDVQAAMLANQAATYLMSGEIPQRQGSAHPSIAPYQPMAVADGYVMFAIGNDKQFIALCDTAGCSELSTDARFSSNAARVAHRLELENSLATFLLKQTIEKWIALGETFGFPCGPINTIDRVFADAQLLSRNMVVTSTDGSRLVANPIKFSETPIEKYNTPPTLKSE